MPGVYTLAVLNQKGGVGKTAITKNLAAALAELGYRVLLLDWDPQGHLTEACGVPEGQPPATLPDTVLLDVGALTLDRVRALITPWRERVDIIPTHEDMYLLERRLYQSRAMEKRLQRVVDLVEELDVYDVCLIDCPPSLGIFADNALIAAGQALVPTQSEDSALRALRLLLKQVAEVRAEYGVQVDLLGLVVNLYDSRRGRIITSTLEALKEIPLPILAVVDDRAVVREAWRAGLPVVEYDTDSPTAGVFRKLAKTLVDRGGDGQAAEQKAAEAR